MGKYWSVKFCTTIVDPDYVMQPIRVWDSNPNYTIPTVDIKVVAERVG